MATQGRIILKTYYETGDKPTEGQFADLVDSTVNWEDDITSPLVDDELVQWDGSTFKSSGIEAGSASIIFGDRDLEINDTKTIKFTSGGFKGSLGVDTLVSNRLYLLPDESGTLATQDYVDSYLLNSATETVEGIAELATNTETQTGTDDTRIVTPLKLSNWWTWVKTQAQIFAAQITFTSAPVFSSTTANQILEVNGSKALVSVAKNTAYNTNVDDSTLEVSGTTLRVKDAGITHAKYQDISNDTVLGNISGSSDSPQEIPVVDIEDSTQKAFKYYGNTIDQFLNTLIWVNTTDKVISNTTTETSLVASSGIGTLSLPADFFRVGKTVRITVKGIFYIDNTSGFRVACKLGSTEIISTSGSASYITPGITVDEDYFEIVAELTCRSLGVSGTFRGIGKLFTSLNSELSYPLIFLALSDVTVNTTGALAIGIVGQFNSASADNTFQVTNLTVEVLA